MDALSFLKQGSASKIAWVPSENGNLLNSEKADFYCDKGFRMGF